MYKRVKETCFLDFINFITYKIGLILIIILTKTKHHKIKGHIFQIIHKEYL